MTLNTSVYVLDEADPREVFFACRELLGADDRHPWFDDPRDDGFWSDGRHTLRNKAGVGLDALLWLYYKPGKPMVADSSVCDPEICDENCDGHGHKPPHWIDLSFDTAYGYRDEQGRTCGVLHASLVAKLGAWLDERGLRWAWQNEFTGEIHIGDRYEHLYDLFEGGDEAARWFEEIVKPAIERHFS